MALNLLLVANIMLKQSPKQNPKIYTMRYQILYALLLGSFLPQVILAARGETLAADSYLVGEAPVLGEYSLGSLVKQGPRINPGWRKAKPWWGNSTMFRIANDTLSRPCVNYAVGGKGQYIPAGEQLELVRYVSRPLDELPFSSTYYLSLILNPGGDVATPVSKSGHALAGFIQKAEIPSEASEIPSLEGILVGVRLDHTSGKKEIVLFTRGSGGKPMSKVLLPDFQTVTVLVILKIEANAISNTKERITYWIDPADISSEQRAQESSYESGQVLADCVDGETPFDHMVVLTHHWPRTFYWDEVRLATSYNDLVTSD